jgi:ankyrin repeat protein
MEVDVNKCTSDGWLPIQLAIDLKEPYYVEKLVNQPGINLNLVTAKGSPLHLAAKEGNKPILMMILDKDVDINIKDNYGKTCIDLCNDSECITLLKKCEDKKETYQ